MRWWFRIQKNACRFQRSRSHDHNPSMGLAMLVRDPIDVVDTLSAPTPVHKQMTHDSIAHQGELSGAGRGWKGNGRTVEIGSSETATLTLVAIVACRSAAMVYGQIGYPVWHHSPTKLALDDLLRHHPATGKCHGREELSVRHLRQTFARATHANETLNAIVIGLKLFVADGPIFSIAVTAGSLEFVVAIAIAFARPTKSPPSHLAAANPHERFVWRKRVRMLEVVHKKLMAVLVAGIA